MRLVVMLHFMLAGLLTGHGNAYGRVAGPHQVEILWAGALASDSLSVRATWEPTVGESTCAALADPGLMDSTTSFPHYIEYSIVNGHRHLLWSEKLSGADLWYCCGKLWATGTLWREGIVITMRKEVSPCPSDGTCDYTRYLFVSTRGDVAASGWDWLDWDPSDPGLIRGAMNMDCITYPMTLEPRVRGNRLAFEPKFPSHVHEGDLIEEDLDEMDGDGCNRRKDLAGRITLSPKPAASVGDSLSLNPNEEVRLFSVVVLAAATPEGVLAPRIVRYGMEVRGKKGYVSLSGLRAIGYLFSTETRDQEEK